jgi:LPXTG-motif cell wall-anchored protein
MTKRLITALLGALLAVVLGATTALAGGADDFAAARAKAAGRFSAESSAKALKTAPSAPADDVEGGGEEPGAGEECVPLSDPSIEELIDALNAGIDEIVETDEGLAAADAKVAAAEEKYFADLEAAKTADEVNAAFRTFAAAIATWASESKARFAALKPQFGEVVATFIDALVEASVCEEDVDFAREDLAEGQFFVDVWQQAVDFVAAEALKSAAKDRDEALEDLPANPKPDDTLPPEDNGPSLPDTGASALPMLLGGLALISGGSTVLVAVRRRRTA